MGEVGACALPASSRDGVFEQRSGQASSSVLGRQTLGVRPPRAVRALCLPDAQLQPGDQLVMLGPLHVKGDDWRPRMVRLLRACTTSFGLSCAPLRMHGRNTCACARHVRVCLYADAGGAAAAQDGVAGRPRVRRLPERGPPAAPGPAARLRRRGERFSWACVRVLRLCAVMGRTEMVRPCALTRALTLTPCVHALMQGEEGPSLEEIEAAARAAEAAGQFAGAVRRRQPSPSPSPTPPQLSPCCQKHAVAERTLRPNPGRECACVHRTSSACAPTPARWARRRWPRRRRRSPAGALRRA